MKKKLIKNLAVVLVALLLTPYALAAGTTSDGVTNSDGSLIGAGIHANLATANVWSIKFPAQSAKFLSFIVDPHKVVGSSGALASDATVENATVLFKKEVDSSGKASTYGSESAPLKVLNMGSTDVVVSLEVQITDTKIAIHTDSSAALNSDATPSLKFTVKEASGSDAVITQVGHVIETDVARKEGAYIVKATGSEGAWTFTYEPTSDGTDNADSDGYWNSASYVFSGEANTNPAVMDDWDDASLVAPNLTLKWVVRNRTVKTINIDTPTIDKEQGFCGVSIKKGFAGQSGKVYIHLNDDFKMNDDAGVTMVYFFKNAEGNIEEKSERLTLDKSGSPAVATKVNNTYSFSFTMPSATQWTDFEPNGTTPNRIRLVDVGGIVHI